MRKYVEVFTRDHLPKLRDQLLFSGLTDHEIFMFIQYAKPYYLSLNRGETARVENKFSHMTGLVFSGTAYLYSVDYNGNKSLLKTIRSGESSGTLYAMFDYYNTLVEIMAGEDCEISFYSAGADVYNRGFACFDSAENPRQYACVTKTGVFADFGTPCLSFKAKYQGQIYAPSSNLLQA